MNFGFSVQDAVQERYSVRTFDSRPVEAEVREQILAYAAALRNPLGPQIKVQFIERESAPNGEKLGTYGVIKGANLYLGVTVPDEAYAAEALGYEFEQLVLYATSLGLGTCWLGGTFNRGAFADAMALSGRELFPILSPIGYPAAKKRVTESVFRRALGADKRLPWSKLFFADNFSHPLSESDAGAYAFPLEMLRLAPSATNRQPWRVVVCGNAFHFFEQRSGGGMKMGGVDMQRIDVGIGICHFHLAGMERGLSGRFERCGAGGLTVPANAEYIVSWIAE